MFIGFVIMNCVSCPNRDTGETHDPAILFPGNADLSLRFSSHFVCVLPAVPGLNFGLLIRRAVGATAAGFGPRKYKLAFCWNKC